MASIVCAISLLDGVSPVLANMSAALDQFSAQFSALDQWAIPQFEGDAAWLPLYSEALSAVQGQLLAAAEATAVFSAALGAGGDAAQALSETLLLSLGTWEALVSSFSGESFSLAFGELEALTPLLLSLGECAAGVAAEMTEVFSASTAATAGLYAEMAGAAEGSLSGLGAFAAGVAAALPGYFAGPLHQIAGMFASLAASARASLASIAASASAVSSAVGSASASLRTAAGGARLSSAAVYSLSALPPALADISGGAPTAYTAPPESAPPLSYPVPQSAVPEEREYAGLFSAALSPPEGRSSGEAGAGATVHLSVVCENHFDGETDADTVIRELEMRLGAALSSTAEGVFG